MSRESTRRFGWEGERAPRVAAWVAAIVVLAVGPSLAETSGPRVGPYAKLGVNVGEPDLDLGRLDAETGGGFVLGAGYFLTPWLAAELDFDFLGGSDVEVGSNEIGEADFWAITANAKLYPIAALDAPDFPTWIQPYGLVGLGGGELEIDFNGGGEAEEDSFVARFSAGIDLLLHERFGAFVEGGYHVFEEDSIDGVGLFTVGTVLRF